MARIKLDLAQELQLRDVTMQRAVGIAASQQLSGNVTETPQALAKYIVGICEGLMDWQLEEQSKILGANVPPQ